jgi:hypothetical protein
MPKDRDDERRHHTADVRQDDPSGDTKDIRIAGCLVHVSYHANTDGTWTIQGAVQCGVEDQRAIQLVTAGPYPDRETGEKHLFDRIATLLGHNEDRNTSRIKNWA